jgi:hypothetical protein
MVSPFLKLLEIDLMPYFVSLDQFEHLLALVLDATHIIAPARASFQFSYYTPEAFAFLHPLHS